MKIFFLLIVVLHININAFSQNQKEQTADSVNYHFSFANKWVVRFAPLQILPGAEIRFYIEKKITNHSSLEIFGSKFINVVANLFFSKDDAMYNKYEGFKVGIDYKYFLPFPRQSNYIELSTFYKNVLETSLSDDNPQIFKQYFYKITCFQALYGKRLETKKMTFDFYCGVGLRTKFVRNIFTLKSSSAIFSATNWHTETQTIGGITFLPETIQFGYVPSIQCGINIGLKIK